MMAGTLKPILLCCILFLVKDAHCNSFYDSYVKDFQEKIKAAPDISPSCAESYSDTGLLINLIDASAKIPDGLLTFAFTHFGRFDECYDLKSVVNKKEVYGKYCLATTPIAPNKVDELTNEFMKLKNASIITPRALGSDSTRVGLNIGYCIPSTCTSMDLAKILDVMGFSAILGDRSTIVTDDYCYSRDTLPELSGGAIGTISFISVILGISLVSTLYDVYLYCNDLKPKMDLLIAFSFLSNGRKIVKSSNNPEQILCLNGLKAISMMWVIVGHEYSDYIMSPMYNFLDFNKFLGQKRNMWMINAPLSVDTFFTIGGLVTMYTFMKSVDKGVKFNIPLYYIHRYLRLTPALGVIILIHSYLLRHMGNGPMWGAVDSILGVGCRKLWWGALLYVQNYVATDSTETCVPQAWYLSVDMQIFILSPLILYPVMKWPKSVNFVLGFFIAAGILIPFEITYVYKILSIQADLNHADKLEDFSSKYYDRTYTRFGPYVIGMLFGYYIYKYKKSQFILDPRKNKLLTLGGWAVTLVGLLACIYGNANDVGVEYSRISSSFFNGFARNGWGVGICLVVLLCTIGLGGPIDAFLSLPVFQILTKLSYSMYLVHYMLILMRNLKAREPIEFSNFNMMHTFWGDFMFTIVFSVLLCLTFESPIIILEKYIFGGAKSKPKPKANKENPAV